MHSYSSNLTQILTPAGRRLGHTFDCISRIVKDKEKDVKDAKVEELEERTILNSFTHANECVHVRLTYL